MDHLVLEAAPTPFDAHTPPEVTALALPADADPVVLSRFAQLRELWITPDDFDRRWADAIAALPSVERLHLCVCRTSAAALEALGAAPSLTGIDFGWRPREVTDEALSALSSLKNLERLSIRWTQAAARTFAALAKLPSLRRLSIAHTRITTATLAKLPPWPHLETLDASSLRFNDAGFDRIAALPSLVALELNDMPMLSPRLFDGLAARAALRELSNTGMLLLPALLSMVERCPIERLSLGGAPGDDDVERLARVPTLTHLALPSGQKLSDRALAALASAPRLNELKMPSGAVFSQPSLRGLAGCSTLRTMELFGTPLDDETLLHWASQGAFERLRVWRCPGLTARGVLAARRARPGCVIEADDVLDEVLPTLDADFFFEGDCHDVDLDADATRFVLDTPGDVRIVDRRGAVLAKRKLVGAENKRDFHRHGRWIVGTQNSGKSGLWDLSNDKFTVIPGLPVTIWVSCVSRDGALIACEAYGDVTLTERGVGARWSRKVAQHVTAIVMSDDCSLVAVGAADGVHVFDANTGEERACIAEGRAPLEVGDGAVVVATRDHQIVRVSLKGQQELARWAPNADARRVVLVSLHAPAVVQPARTLEFATPTWAIRQWHRTESSFVALCTDRMAHAMLLSPDVVVTLQNGIGPAGAPQLSADGRWLAWPSECFRRGVVRVWSVEALLSFARAHGADHAALAAARDRR